MFKKPYALQKESSSNSKPRRMTTCYNDVPHKLSLYPFVPIILLKCTNYMYKTSPRLSPYSSDLNDPHGSPVPPLVTPFQP